MRVYKLLSAASIAALLVSCSTVDVARLSSAGIKTVQASNISDEQINSYVSQYVKSLDAESNIATGNDPYNVRLNRIAGSFNNTDGINIKVYKQNEVNAFATADGSVRVYSGLMDLMTDEEVLGVIGHEIGHVKNHDTRDAFKKALQTSALRDVVASTSTVGAVLSDSQLGDIGESLVQSGYSRKQESEADVYGYNFLVKHGINPWVMASAFEKMLQMEKQQGTYSNSSFQQMFSSHPDLQKRVDDISKRATKDGYSRPVNGNIYLNTKSGNTNTSGAATSNQWSF